jgi:hypothetical protein
MKTFFTLFLLFFSAVILNAQTGGDIVMKKTKFYEDNRLLKPKDVLSRMQVDEEAYKTFKKAKANYDAGQAMGFVGGFLIGWPVGTAFGGGDPEWGLAGAGAALVIGSLPLMASFKKHSKNALSIYNAKAHEIPVKIDFHASVTSAGIAIRF